MRKVKMENLKVTAKLRRRAEEQVKLKGAGKQQTEPEIDLRRLLHGREGGGVQDRGLRGGSSGKPPIPIQALFSSTDKRLLFATWSASRS
jgi:hypothetical protein